MADNAEDDPVIDEIDVFLSKSLSENLYLMQYPLRPKHMGYSHLDHISARVKPQQKRVEIELALDTRSKNYSSSKGEQIAVNVDGNLPPNAGDRIFSSSKMDKITLSCPPHTESFPNCQYGIGLLKEGELHVTPLSAIVQMRPNFDYLDRADTRHRAETANTSLGDGGESSQDEAEEDPTPVSMKVSRGESEEFKARRMASYEYVNQKREEERWIRMSYFTADSGLVEAERQQLQAGDAPHVSQFKISPHEYLQALIPPSYEDKSEKPAMPDNVLSLNELRKLDLNDQIKALLINVKVIRFDQLVSFLARGTDHQAILRSLQNMAVLVQGCWVVKSELLYPDEDKEELGRKRRPNSAVSPELLRRVRDYAMWKFTHCKYVVRKDISSIVQLPSDDVKEILEKMSRLKARSGWEFMYDYDRGFCERFPDIVQRQKNKWALLFHSLEEHFKMPKDGDKKALELEKSLLDQLPTERHRHRRLSSRSSPRKRTLSGRSQSDVSDIEMDSVADTKSLSGCGGAIGSIGRNILDEPHLVNGTGGFGSSQLNASQIGGRRSRSNSHTSPSAGCGSLERRKVVEDVKNVHSEIFSSSDIAVKLKSFVQEQLAQNTLLPMSDLRNQMSLYTARVPAAHKFLSGGVSDKAIEDAVSAVGGFRLNNQFPPNSKQEAIFSSYTGDKRTDQLRKILFSLFEDSSKIRSAAFRSKANSQGIDLSEAELKRFLKDDDKDADNEHSDDGDEGSGDNDDEGGDDSDENDNGNNDVDVNSDDEINDDGGVDDGACVGGDDDKHGDGG
ncbi:DNA-directed RNA polymerase iii subunit rpc5 [Plakobranchus ocellatus]|uniref:DNA-directed RNA polymerase iii subunit rpc5 n=1 Tax=Plakobranchus ocellatus TaxID=259542 RepID=A0AAV3Y6H3_9GAST|nr:DNA-directed RNA polymerase iii subunit rpc5 [Plakobranchus ocellatus]